mgnify:CR=1 FL=1
MAGAIVLAVFYDGYGNTLTYPSYQVGHGFYEGYSDICCNKGGGL